MKKIRCSECGKKIELRQQFRKIQNRDICEDCYQLMGGYSYYSALKKAETGSNKPVPPPGSYMRE